MEILRFDKVSFTYPTEKKAAIEDISFSLEEGSFLVICGKSGCGKSTLMKHMKKEYIPFGQGTGHMYFYGENIEELEAGKSSSQIGFVGQAVEEQIVTDKVWHELAFGLESLGVSSVEIQQRIGELAEYFGISNWFHKSVNELSGGQKQILNLASVMVLQPKLLVLDEPTAQLDPIGAQRFIQTLQKLNQDFGTTIVVSEQRLEEILPVADQIMVMHQGKMVGIGPARECVSILQKGREQFGRELPISVGMPVPVRLYSMLGGTGQCPLTVREGKQWLQQKIDSGNISTGKTMTEGLQKQENQMEMAVIAKNMDFYYDRGKTVLQRFSISIPKQSIYAVLGGNGSGKTTAVKILAGVKKAKRGKVKVSGTTGYLAQNPQTIFTETTVEEELAEVLLQEKGNVSMEHCRQQVENMLVRMDLAWEREKNPFDLSGGQAQRLALGKLLLANPDILFLDEPTKGMDAAFKKKFGEMLESLQKDGKTIVLVTHDMTFCAEYATHCGLLFDGQVISSLTVRDFFCSNVFYTTPARKIAGNLFPACITAEEVAAQMCPEEIQNGKS